MKKKQKQHHSDKYARVLSNWGELNKELNVLTEQELNSLIQRERAGKQRNAYLSRLHGRFNKLRAIRERQELLGGS